MDLRCEPASRTRPAVGRHGYDRGLANFVGQSLMVGGSVDLSEGPGLGLRMILNSRGETVGWTGEINFSVGAPAASAVEFTRTVVQTDARFTRVRTQGLGFVGAMARPFSPAQPTPMVGGLPLYAGPTPPPGAVPPTPLGWNSRAARRNDSRRIWA